MAECFSLSASPFFFTYTDDDGEDFPIRTESDLTEAILYFVSGDDDAAHSSHSGSAGPVPFSSQKVTIRVDVVVEYDGPSLSDTSSLRSYKSGDEASESSWRSSGYEPSHRSSGRNELEDQVIVEEEERTEYAGSAIVGLGSVHSARLSGSNTSSASTRASVPQAVVPRSRSDRSRSTSSHTSTISRRRPPASTQPHVPSLTGPESDPAPSLLTHSELGSRWLREQSRLAVRRIGPGTTANGTTRRYGSDEESLGSDEDSRGDFALVRDARGSMSLFPVSRSSADEARVLLLLPKYRDLVSFIALRSRFQPAERGYLSSTVPELLFLVRDHNFASWHAYTRSYLEPAARCSHPRTRLLGMRHSTRIHPIRVSSMWGGRHVEGGRAG